MNSKAVKQRFAATGRTMQGWAKARGFNGQTVRLQIAGALGSRETRLQRAILEALKEDGLYVPSDEAEI